MHDSEPTYEFERRFLVNDTSIARGRDWELITQAYVFAQDGYAIRVRLTQRELVGEAGDGLEDVSARATVKGPRFDSRREEYEIEISGIVARGIIDRSANVVRKRRHYVVTDQTWEVDEFLDDNQGLWIAELESSDPKTLARVHNPPWAHTEVTSDSRYDNEQLAQFPTSGWDPS